jgi:crotonobetainyl-CoA:carnitine CoA-transferase CaiB-like acyl-CoA transferase
MYELLKGTRIIDLTTTYLGPYATQLLGDMGADVIKIEALGGDVGRSPLPSRSPEMGAGFINSNRNKRSIAIDLKQPRGLEIVLKLAGNADAVVHNMRPKAAEKLGLGPDQLRKVNSGIVYCFAAGFGQDGPYADEPAYDDIIQAMCGLASLNADPSGAPRFLPTIAADKVVGVNLAFAVATGLAHRFKTGEGCTIEVPMFETMVAFLLVEHLAGESFVPPLGFAGYERLLVPNRRPYATRDGFIAIMPYTTEQWMRFFASIGRSDLLALDWIKDPVQRSANVNTLYGVIADAAPQKTTAEWLDLLGAEDIPCGRVNRLSDLLAEPHLKAVGLFRNLTHPSEGEMRSVRSPFAVSGVAETPDLPAPALGESTVSILKEAGFTDAEARELISTQVVRSR